MSWRDRIVIDPQVCEGKPCIRGSQVRVSAILDYLKAGDTHEAILEQHPSLKPEDIQAALGFAAELTQLDSLPFFQLPPK